MIKVLVVDDSALARKLFVGVLEKQSDFEVQYARDGSEALEKLEEFQPDVVTLDVHMPRMDGLACLDRIMVVRPCPVIMVSSLTGEGADATLEALRLGAVDFIAKPEGAVSLGIKEFAPRFVEKVRAASTIRLKASLRLKDRVRHRSGLGYAAPRVLKKHLAAGVPAGNAPGNCVVLVGTSTGGPPALEALLSRLPADFPFPVLIAQHMPAGFTGPLAARLNGLCAVQVMEVLRPTLIQAGCAYIGRGDADLIVVKRAAGLMVMPVPAQADYPWHPSTHRLVMSAMDHVPAEQLIGVLMTGMGDDGASAMARLNKQGGRTIAESEETAIVWGMPGELVKAGGATWIEPLPRIADRLLQLTANHAAHP